MACNMIDIEYYHSKNMSDELFYRIYHEYEEYKKKNGFLDFDDMVSQCYNLLKDRQDILEAIRSFIHIFWLMSIRILIVYNMKS